MRHRVKKKVLNTTPAHRKTIVKGLCGQLIEYEKIETTLAKAKYFQPYVENLITRAKKIDKKDKVSLFNSVKYLRTKLLTEEAITKLIEEVGPRFAKRNGGYTRVVRIGNRDGDNAPMARIELVETKAVEKKVAEKEALKKITKGKSKGVAKKETEKEGAKNEK
jgi:large subunit ribosomal protein L17